MVAMPKKAAIHIQKMAPGPPMAMAVAAPARLPVPTWAAMAVATDWKELMPCLSARLPFRERSPKSMRTACPNLRIWMNFSRMVKYMPTPHSSGIRQYMPQMKLLMLETSFVNSSMVSPSGYPACMSSGRRTPCPSVVWQGMSNME